jgi:hypothetical protein
LQIRRISINGRDYVLANPNTAAQLLLDIESAARSGPAWVTIPVRETNPPKVLITSNVECFLEILEIPDEDPETEGAAIAFDLNWPAGL